MGRFSRPLRISQKTKGTELAHFKLWKSKSMEMLKKELFLKEPIKIKRINHVYTIERKIDKTCFGDQIKTDKIQDFHSFVYHYQVLISINSHQSRKKRLFQWFFFPDPAHSTQNLFLGLLHSPCVLSFCMFIWFKIRMEALWTGGWEVMGSGQCQRTEQSCVHKKVNHTDVLP